MKRRKSKVIQINGTRGLLLACMAVVCLIAGFVVFPGYLASNLWNNFVTFLPEINLFQGVMLWLIVAISFFLATRKRKEAFIALKSTTELNENELREVMHAIKEQSHRDGNTPFIVKSEDLRQFELREITRPVDFDKKAKTKIAEESNNKENV